MCKASFRFNGYNSDSEHLICIKTIALHIFTQFELACGIVHKLQNFGD